MEELSEFEETLYQMTQELIVMRHDLAYLYDSCGPQLSDDDIVILEVIQDRCDEVLEMAAQLFAVQAEKKGQ